MKEGAKNYLAEQIRKLEQYRRANEFKRAEVLDRIALEAAELARLQSDLREIEDALEYLNSLPGMKP